jgi:twitching motility two-component system response regulator PilG
MRKKRILVIEDEESLLKLETILLTVKGYAVTGSKNGADAMKIVAEGNFDLILLDIMLPDMDGFELCRRVKLDPRTAAIPVVMLTAKKSSDDQDRGVASGASAYLTKPFKSAMIIETIDKLLQGIPLSHA